MVSFCHGKVTDCLGCYRHDSCPKLRNPFDVASWRGFWERIEQEWAEELKRLLYYPSGWEMPCECGSSTCPECNPDGFDDGMEDEEEFDW